jgi:hypothetical protein
LKPLRLTFLGRQVAQRRMDACALRDIVEEATDWLVGRMKVGVRVADHRFFREGPHEALRIARLGSLPDSGHTESGADISQGLNIGRRSLLDALVGVVALRPMLRQSPLQGG